MSSSDRDRIDLKWRRERTKTNVRDFRNELSLHRWCVEGLVDVLVVVTDCTNQLVVVFIY